MKDRETKPSKEKLSSITIGVFSAMIIVVCYLLFLFNYDTAYSGGDYISGRMVVIFYHFLIFVFSILVAVILKLVLKKKVQLRFLLLIAVLLPILCYQVNYHTLKKDGLFYSLVDDGGVFHFIVIGDFDFDGMNDEEHHRLYEERTNSTSYSDIFRDEIKWVTTDATGIGAGLNGTYFSLDGKERNLTLHLNKNGVKFKEIRLEIEFADPKLGQSFSLYLQTDSGEVLVDHTVNDDGTVSVFFDADTCSNWQKNSEKEFIRIVFRYEFGVR